MHTYMCNEMLKTYISISGAIWVSYKTPLKQCVMRISLNFGKPEGEKRKCFPWEWFAAKSIDKWTKRKKQQKTKDGTNEIDAKDV